MEIYSIDCKKYKLNGTQHTFGAEKVLETDNKEIHASFFIECDNEQDNFSFNLEHYGDDAMDIQQNRCEIDVYIKENKTPHDKYFTILCTHSNDKEVYVEIKIVQTAEEYSVSFNQSGSSTSTTHEFKSEITSAASGYNNSRYNYWEEKTFNVYVKGGSKKYRIESILKCHEEAVQGSSEPRYIYSQFDNGFIYTKNTDSLVIRNYGRPFMDENDYYVITLCHDDYRYKKATIKITYQPISTPAIRSRKKKTTKQSAVQTQDTNIYNMNLYISKEETAPTTKVENVCQIIFNGNMENIEKTDEENYKIVGQKNATLSFKVLEGESADNMETSNLMVKTSAFGNWCSLSLDETDLSDRKLKISILNKPICERKVKIVMSIIDFPSEKKMIILTNI